VRTIAIVPVKTLALAKTRLAAALTPDERIALMRRTLRRVLAALDLPQIALRVVISPDEGILRDARAAGAHGLLQVSVGLNPGLDEARDWAVAHGAEALLIALGDLPLLSREHVAALLAQDGGPNSLVLGPDRHGAGTNLLLLHPPGAIPFLFGVGSLARHLAAAEAGGLSTRLYEHPATALDLDTPDDLAALEGLLSNVAADRG
jgi:2-phospho-L-lactate guanylyltransferase